MTAKSRLRILMLSAFAGALLVPAYASAQDAQTQKQLDDLQQQLQALQKQVNEAKKAAKDAAQTSQAVQAQAAAMKGAYGDAAPVLSSKEPWALPAGVKLSWGGFIAAEGVWRNRSEMADINTDFNNIPYALSPQYHENELRFTARQSRLWWMGEGNISDKQKIYAYFETDFLGAATTSNSIQSNSYTPRIRQAFLNYDDNYNGWHVLAGQTWSLLTQNRVGIKERQENIPLTIDAQYTVGFNWTRNAQIRVVKDVSPGITVGVSAESPQVRFQSPGSNLPQGLFINSTNLGTQSGLMDTLQQYSIDQVPDFIEKIAFDPGWGHYEVLGLQRFFTDRVQPCNPTAANILAGAACAPGLGPTNIPIGTASNLNTFGWGVGGSVLLPAVPKFLDLQGSVLYGKGIGRYGDAQLPDVTFARNGSLQPITSFQTLVGAVAHVNPDLDFYVYAGLEQNQSNWSSVGANNIGFGNPNYSDGTCFTENSTAVPAVPNSQTNGLLSTTGCSVNVKRVEEIQVGFWQNFYKGPMGRITAGASFEYIHRDTFPGANAIGTVGATNAAGAQLTPVAGLVSPRTDEAVVMTSLRYYFP
jgi:hypothetical protein